MRRKSAAMQQAEGDPRKYGVHKLDELLASEPKTERGLLPCPSRLKGDARKLYEFFREQLELSELDQKPDSHALATACTALATAWKAQRHLDREGEIIKVPIMAGLGNKRKIVGYHQQRNRWFAIKIESEKQFARFAGNFGITGPSSRAGMEAQSLGADDDKLWELLSTPRPKGEDANREPTQ